MPRFGTAPALGALLALLAASPATGQTPTETSTGAAADPTATALEAFNRARGNYRDGKYVEALVDFQKAYELNPTPALTYNIARCYEQLSQYREAIATYERFVKESSDPREKADALDKIEFLKTKLAPSASDPEEQYKARVEAGKKAYAKGDYERAIEEFKAAFDAKANSGPLFNIAKAYERMGRYEEAIEYFQQYLDLDPNAPDRADIEETIRRLRKSIRERFQELSVSSNPPGADIYLDDRNTGLQGQTNFRFKVQPGPHTLYLDLNGYEPVKRDFVMPDDKPLALEFELKKLENVGFVEFKVNVAGARIFVDGAIIGLSPYTQKKALPAGAHQIQIEARGYPRYTADFTVQRDATTPVNVNLETYVAPVSGETLGKWGRNLLLIGFIGGGLGFGGPFVYQKLIRQRPLYEALGPSEVAFGEGVANPTFWRGRVDASGAALPDGSFNDSYRENSEVETLKLIQLISAISGGVFVAAGVTFHFVKWFRPEENVEIIQASTGENGPPTVSIDALGLVPAADGATFGLTGSF